MEPHHLAELRTSDLLVDLDEHAFPRLAAYGTVVKLVKDTVLFEEGDEPDRFFVILSGTLEVMKRDESGRFVARVATLESGQSVGEFPLIEPGPRSATVRTNTETTLVAFPIDDVRRELFEGELHYPYMPLLRKLEARLVARIKAMSSTAIELLEAERRHLAQQNEMSTFIIYMITVLCSFMFLTELLSRLTSETTGSTLITLPVIVALALVLIRPVRSLGLPWGAYGVTRNRWKASLRDGLVFSLPLILVATAIKALVSDGSIIDVLETRTRELGSFETALAHVVTFNLLYVAFVVPIQEIISRGLLQGLLERFIASERRTLLAILISNLVFSAFHLYLSLVIAVLTLFLGIYLGWLYTRTRNLLGPSVAHAIAGVWALSVVRLQPYLT
ncbi:MAG: cyclic nucleotide-binding domain-containing protein [Myxococcota bacterium]